MDDVMVMYIKPYGRLSLWFGKLSAFSGFANGYLIGECSILEQIGAMERECTIHLELRKYLEVIRMNE
jgi:hypothetical protein